MDNIIDLDEKRKARDLDYETVNDMEYEAKQWSPIDEGMSGAGSGVWDQEVKAWIDLMTLKGLFFNEEWVFILIDRICSKIAPQQLKVMTERLQDGEMVSEPAGSNPVQEMLWKPNDKQTYYQWMYSIACDYAITGNAIVWKSPISQMLIHIPIEMVQLDFDTNGNLRSYRIIQYSTNYEMPIPREIMKLDPKDVAHMRRPNPSSALWGLSPLIPARKSVLFNRYSMEYLNNYYLKGAQPGLILSFDDAANEKAALRLLKSLEIAHTGRKNQRRGMVLPKGVKATTVDQKLADQDLKEYLVLNREAIINIYQVPKEELSITDASKGLGSKEYKHAIRNFWAGPLKADMSSIEESLTQLLQDELGQGFYLEFDVSDVEALQDDLNEKADLAIKMLQTHTLNEVRAKVFKDKPLPGGDNLPGPQVVTAPNPNINNSSAVIPEVKTEPVVATPEVKVDERQSILDKNLSAWETTKNTNPLWWEQRQAVLAKDEAQRFSDVHKTSLQLFASQLVSMVAIIKQGMPKAKTVRAIKAVCQSHEQGFIDKMQKILEHSMNLGYEAQLMLPEKKQKAVMPNRSAIEALRSRNIAKRNDMLEGRISHVFAGMNNTTTDKVITILDEGITSGRSIDEIAANITQDIAGISDSRAQTIARTEVLTATSMGQAAAMQDAATVIPNLKKMWINAGDGRVRGNPGGLYAKSTADHWTLGGELVEHDEKFSNGLDFPRDPASKDGGEVINCRCTFVMVPGDDAEAMGIQRAQDAYDDAQGTNNGG